MNKRLGIGQREPIDAGEPGARRRRHGGRDRRRGPGPVSRLRPPSVQSFGRRRGLAGLLREVRHAEPLALQRAPPRAALRARSSSWPSSTWPASSRARVASSGRSSVAPGLLGLGQQRGAGGRVLVGHAAGLERRRAAERVVQPLRHLRRHRRGLARPPGGRWASARITARAPVAWIDWAIRPARSQTSIAWSSAAVAPSRSPWSRSAIARPNSAWKAISDHPTCSASSCARWNSTVASPMRPSRQRSRPRSAYGRHSLPTSPSRSASVGARLGGLLHPLPVGRVRGQLGQPGVQLDLRGQHPHLLGERQRLLVRAPRAPATSASEISRWRPSADSARIVSPSSEPRASSTARSRFSRAFCVSPMRPKTRPKIPWARLAARVSSSRSASRSAFSDA